MWTSNVGAPETEALGAVLADIGRLVPMEARLKRWIEGRPADPLRGVHMEQGGDD
jgi:hypothetical protein